MLFLSNNADRYLGEARKQRGSSKTFVQVRFCKYGSVNKQWGGYALLEERCRVSVPKFNTGIWVSVPAREGIGTPGIDTCYQGIDTPLTLH
ncbi:hypothetical protein GQ457_09G019810 [Hibiscus cannabinus]